jgi:hypothetical protein
MLAGLVLLVGGFTACPSDSESAWDCKIGPRAGPPPDSLEVPPGYTARWDEEAGGGMWCSYPS